MKTAFALLTLSLAVPAFAQINYDEINRQVESEKKSKISLKKIAQDVGGAVDDLFIADEKVRFLSPARDLTATEEKQVELLNCVRKFLAKGKGGYNGPKVAASIIGDELPESDEGIKAAVHRCEDATANLARLKKIDYGRMKKEVQNLQTSTTVYKLISNFVFPKEGCMLRSFTGQAAHLAGAGAGVAVLRCFSTTGEMKNFVGPTMKIGLGFGAMVGVNSYKSESVAHNFGNVIRLAGVDNGSEMDGALGIGTNHPDRGSSTNVYVGAGIMFSISGVAGVRVLNSAHRWDIVFDNIRK